MSSPKRRKTSVCKPSPKSSAPKDLPGYAVEMFLGEVPDAWDGDGGCMEKAMKLISMWGLMVVENVEESGFFEKALEKHNITCKDDLYRLADKRFETMDVTPSSSPALDALVVAAAFSMENDAGGVVGWMDVAKEMQKKETEKLGPVNLDALFDEMCGVLLFGFDMEEVDDALHKIFDEKPDFSALVEAMKGVKHMKV